MATSKITLRDIFDLSMLSCIFLMTIVELSSFYFQTKYDTYSYPKDNPYLYYYMPLLSSLTILIASSFFLFRIFRFKACRCTQVITITYFVDQLFTTLLIFVGYNERWYHTFIYPLYLFTIIGLFIYLFCRKIITYYKIK